MNNSITDQIENLLHDCEVISSSLYEGIYDSNRPSLTDIPYLQDKVAQMELLLEDNRGIESQQREGIGRHLKNITPKLEELERIFMSSLSVKPKETGELCDSLVRQFEFIREILRDMDN